MVKKYWALVEEVPQPPGGRWVDWLKHHDRHRKVLAVEAEQAGAKRAELSYRLLDPLGGYQCLEIQLQTGRKHQIRLQLSHDGYPILGDRKYGSEVSFPKGIALHAYSLSFQHPVQGQRMEFTAPLPASWKSFGY